MKCAFYFAIHLATLSVTSQINRGYDNFVYLSESQGLSESAAMSIEKDDLGYIWIGTKKGLNRFDGEHFTVFRRRDNDTTSLSSDQIHSLKKGKNGVMWIGTSQGINRFDPNTQKFKQFNSFSKLPLQSKKITSICTMSDGITLFGSFNGLFIHQEKSDTIVKYLAATSGQPFFKNNPIFKIFKDSENIVWIGTQYGLYKTIKKTINGLNFSKITSQNNELDNIHINDITEGPDGKLWIGTQEKGLFQYDKTKRKLASIKNTFLPKSTLRDLQFDHENNLWIASFSGLTILKQDGTVIHSKHTGRNGETINDGLKTIFMDDQGSIWIGGFFGGIKVWNKTLNVINTLDKVVLSGIKTDLGMVNAISEDPDGKIYLGTKKNGITVLNSDLSINENLTLQLTKKLADITVKSMWIEDNLLWVASRERGVLIFDLITRTFLPNYLDKELQTILQKSNVYSMSKSNSYIAFGLFDSGILIHDLVTKKTTITKKNFLIDQVELGNVRVLYFDKKQNLWIGSNTGLKIISEKNLMKEPKAIRNIPLLKNSRHTYAKVFSITADKTGKIMVGTNGQGLFMENDSSNDEKKSFKKTEVHLPYVTSSVEDKEQNLWLASHDGVAKYNPKNQKVSFFNDEYGLTSFEFRNHSQIFASNGYIFMGTSKGVLYFKPKNLNTIVKPSPVKLTTLRLLGMSNSNGDDENHFKKNISNIDQLTLSHEENLFEINFSAFDFTKILNNSYEYRLLGLNDSWQETTNAAVSYTLQKPGNYQFQVRSKKTEGQTENKITSLKIQLKAAPWKSRYAISFYILCICLGIYGIYRILKSKTALKHRLELENLEKEKENERHKSQLEFFTSLSHDFRTPLTLILAPLHQLLEKYEGSNLMYRKLLAIKRNADLLLNLVNQLLDFRKIDANTTQLSLKKTNIVTFIEAIYSSFEEYAKIGNYNFVFKTISNDVNLYFDPQILERVFYNLISNAFKNTPIGGEIEISIIENNHTVLIKIKDTGKGIDVAQINKIFDRFYTIEDDTRDTAHFLSGSGIGLHIVKRTIDLHQGQINVKSAKNEGTVFTVTLQKGIAHFPNSLIKKGVTNTTKNVSTTEVYKKSKEIRELSLQISQENKEHTVLIVEDNDELRKFIVDMLKTDFNIVQATNGKEALNEITKKEITLIISDVVMPKMSGIELCQKTKQDHRTSHIPIILLTSKSSSSQKIAGLESGADAYITKPFVVKEFLLTVKNLTSTYQQSNEKKPITQHLDFGGIQITSEDEALQKKAIAIIQNNINNSSFEVTTFSTELGISRSKLFRKIKDWTGQTPKDYVQSVRLQKAAQLLELGELSISDICYEVGFASPPYFAKCFKKQYQLTPTEYANKFNKV